MTGLLGRLRSPTHRMRQRQGASGCARHPLPSAFFGEGVPGKGAPARPFSIRRLPWKPGFLNSHQPLLRIQGRPIIFV